MLSCNRGSVNATGVPCLDQLQEIVKRRILSTNYGNSWEIASYGLNFITVCLMEMNMAVLIQWLIVGQSKEERPISITYLGGVSLKGNRVFGVDQN